VRGLASFAMSGRYRALLVAVASSGSLLFGWIGAAVVALVTLRKGYGQGLWVLLWALLPALLLSSVTGDSSAVALLVGTAALALVLRAAVSLPLAALASAGVAALTGLGLLAFGQELLAELVRVFEEFFRAVQNQAQRSGEATGLVLRPPNALQMAGMMGTANGGLSFLCLVLARYWQAALYNPGGFGEEFRALRFPPSLVGGLALAALALSYAGLSYRSWAAALMLPLTIAGWSLLHARARHRGQGSLWLGALYLLWLVFDAAKLALVGLVIADALVDFRQRWARHGGGTAPGKYDRTATSGDDGKDADTDGESDSGSDSDTDMSSTSDTESGIENGTGSGSDSDTDSDTDSGNNARKNDHKRDNQ
jgi:hypothetical protein